MTSKAVVALCLVGCCVAGAQAWGFQVHHPHSNLHWPNQHDRWSNRHHQTGNEERVHSLHDWNSFFDDPFFHEQIWPWAGSRQGGNCGNTRGEPSERKSQEYDPAPTPREETQFQHTVHNDELYPYSQENSRPNSHEDLKDLTQFQDSVPEHSEYDHDEDATNDLVQPNYHEARSIGTKVSESLSDTEKLIEQKKAEIRQLEELLALEKRKEELLQLQRREAELKLQREQQLQRRQAELKLQREQQARQQELENIRQQSVRTQERQRADQERQQSWRRNSDNRPSNVNRPVVDNANDDNIKILNRKDNPRQPESKQSCKCGQAGGRETHGPKGPGTDSFQEYKMHPENNRQTKETDTQHRRETIQDVPVHPSRPDKTVYRPGHREVRENHHPRSPAQNEGRTDSSLPQETKQQKRRQQWVLHRAPVVEEAMPPTPEREMEAERRQRVVTIAELDVPGYYPKDIQVHTVGSKVHVHGAQACSCSDSCVAREFERILTLPEGVDTSSVEAQLDKDARLLIKGTSFLDGQVSRVHREVPVVGVGIPMHQPIPTCTKGKKGYTAGKMNAQTGESYVLGHEQEAEVASYMPDFDDVTIETVDDY